MLILFCAQWSSWFMWAFSEHTSTDATVSHNLLVRVSSRLQQRRSWFPFRGENSLPYLCRVQPLCSFFASSVLTLSSLWKHDKIFYQKCLVYSPSCMKMSIESSFWKPAESVVYTWSLFHFQYLPSIALCHSIWLVTLCYFNCHMFPFVFFFFVTPVLHLQWLVCIVLVLFSMNLFYSYGLTFERG